MRVLRTSLAMAAMLGLAPALAVAQFTPETILTRYTPVFRGVDYDLPAAAVKGDDPAIKAAVAACKVEVSPKGFTVRDGQGKILRQFLDTNGKRTLREKDGEKSPGTHLDQWSWYQDGFEVYRQVDLDEDGLLDEVRWMNAGGTRIGRAKQNEDGRGFQIVSWTRISAEEASKVLVQALITGDTALLETVIATPAELASIGAPKSTIDRATEAASTRSKSLAALQTGVKNAVGAGQTVWSRFDGAMPHVIPAQAVDSLKSEVMLYENVVIFADSGNPEKNATLGYLSLPEVVKVGDCWKFVQLPTVVDPRKPAGGSLVSLRGDIYSEKKDEIPDGLAKAIKALGDFDAAGPPAENDQRKIADWNLARVELLREIISLDKDPASKLSYQKQAVNNLGDAIQTDLFPAGMAVLDKYIEEKGKIGSFAAYRKILIQFNLDTAQPGANFLQAQTACLEKFEKYLGQFPEADEVPEVLLQLASVNEFNGSEADAKKWFGQLARDHAATEAGKKAVGALRRLDIDGKPFKLAGTSTSGKAISVDSYRGKPVLVVYWTSLSDGDQKELKEVAALREKLGPKGFDVLAVSLDDDPKALDAYLKASPLPWETLHEPGGMDSRPANEMGIISTPTMILLDAKGQVVNHKIRKAAEVDKALEKALAGKGVGLNTLK